MTVSRKRERAQDPEGDLVGLPGGNAAEEARTWLTGRLRWEDRLLTLERGAGHAVPAAPTVDGDRRAS